MAVVSLSYLFGDAAARAFMGLLFELGLSSREVFWIAGGVLFVLWLSSWLWLKESPARHRPAGARGEPVQRLCG